MPSPATPRITIAYSVVAAALGFLSEVAAADELAAPTPNYQSDIAPILFAHCVGCHSPGQVAPMSLLTYDETRPWAKSIRKAVESREMPPFHAVGEIGRYRDDPRLSDDEIAAMLRWVDAGAPEAGGVEPPIAPAALDSEWPLGPPDIIAEFPPVLVRSTSTDRNVRVYSEVVLDGDTWVKAIAFAPGNRKIAHHATVFAVNPLLSAPVTKVHEIRLGARVTAPDFADPRILLLWLPGKSPRMFDEGVAMKIGAGKRIAAEIHYSAADADETAISRVGLYLANGPIAREALTLGVMLTDLDIAPGDAEYRRSVEDGFEEDVLVTGFNTHMHYRGWSNEIRFAYPDGHSETVFSLPRFSFDWQRDYLLAEPMEVPAGTRVINEAVWNNSASNPRNPDPTSRVRWGIRTEDEMYGSTVYYVRKAPLNPPLRIVAGTEAE